MQNSTGVRHKKKSAVFGEKYEVTCTTTSHRYSCSEESNAQSIPREMWNDTVQLWVSSAYNIIQVFNSVCDWLSITIGRRGCYVWSYE